MTNNYIYGGVVESLDGGSSLKDTDPLSNIIQAVNQKNNYSGTEPGLFHPVENQTIKVRDNGMIDIFVNKNNGIRIDPHTSSINTMANHMKNHLHFLTFWISGNENHYIKGNLVTRVYGKVTYSIDKETYFETKDSVKVIIDKDSRMWIKGDSSLLVDGDVSLTVKGNLNAKVVKDATIEVDGSLKAKAKQISLESKEDIKIYAGKDLKLDAKNKIYWG